MAFFYKFPAVRGMQANSEYYISMVPLKYLSKIFVTEDDYIIPEQRAQRKINETRIPEISKYILSNRNSYVFSALSASIDGEFKFVSYNGGEEGCLEVSIDAVILINDGQHRKAAIEQALQEDPTLEEETISIVFFKDQGLKRSQQMFTDLNKHAVKTSNSLSTLYDYRDQLAVATKEVINKVPFFRMYTDKERDILGKNSSKLFTLNNLYRANQKIVKTDDIDTKMIEFLIDYWNLIANNIIEWNEVMQKELTKKELRENYIVTLAVTLNAFGKLGRYFYENPKVNMSETLSKLKKIDWLRSNNENWKYRTIRSNGKVMNTEQASSLTCSQIKKLIGISLSKDEMMKETELKIK